MTKNMYELTKGRRTLTEDEWRALGVQQSLGWQHYEIYPPERHVLLFRRPHGQSQPATVTAIPSAREESL